MAAATNQYNQMGGNPSQLQYNPPPSVGGNSGNGASDTIIFPSSFTLTATGTGAVVKLQSYDSTYESINGTLGSATFAVTELPDRASIGDGGVTLLGVDVLRKFLSVYAVRIDYVNYLSSSAVQLANPLKFYTAGIDGTNTTKVKSIAKDLSNLANVSTLQPVTGIPLLKHNTAMTVLVNNTATVSLTFAVNSCVPYNTYMGMGFSN